jgi:hypothetical protein
VQSCGSALAVEHLERLRAKAYNHGVRLRRGGLVLALGALAVSSCTSHNAIRPVTASDIEGTFTIQGGPAPPTGVSQRVEPLAGAPIEVRHPHASEVVAKTATDDHGRFHVAVAAMLLCVVKVLASECRQTSDGLLVEGRALIRPGLLRSAKECWAAGRQIARRTAGGVRQLSGQARRASAQPRGRCR